MSSASASKAAGNLAFKQANYPLALAHYTTAHQQDPSEFTYPLNRALVHLKLEQWKDAEKDATTALKLMPHQPKALFRRGLARKGRGELKGAREDFEEAKRCGAGEEVEKELKELDQRGLGDEKKDKKGVKPSPPPPLTSSAPPTNPKSTTTPPSSQPSPAPTPSPNPNPTRSRLLSALSPPSSSSASSKPTPTSTPTAPTSTTSSPKPPAPPPAQGRRGAGVEELLQAVSTRRLTRPPPSPSSVAASPSLSTAIGGAEARVAGKRENAFERMKKEREAKGKSRGTFGGAGAAAGGGDGAGGRKDNMEGEGKEEEEKKEPTFTPSTTTTTTTTASSSAPKPKLKPDPTLNALPLPPSLSSASTPAPAPPPLAAATTVTSLELLLSSSASSPDAQAENLALLKSLPLPSLAQFFASSLTPDLLSLILGVLLSPASPSPSPSAEDELLQWRLEFLNALTKVQRFEMCRMFLEEGEREGIRTLLQRGREALDKLGREWDV